MFLVQTKLLMQTSHVRVCVLQNSFGLVGTFSQRPAIQTITIHIVNCQFSILTLHFWPFLLLLQCLSQIKVSGTQRFQWSLSTSYTTSSATQAGNVRCNHTGIRQGIFMVIYISLSYTTNDWLKRQTARYNNTAEGELKTCWHGLTSEGFQHSHFPKHIILAFDLNEFLWLFTF